MLNSTAYSRASPVKSEEHMLAFRSQVVAQMALGQSNPTEFISLAFFWLIRTDSSNSVLPSSEASVNNSYEDKGFSGQQLVCQARINVQSLDSNFVVNLC